MLSGAKGRRKPMIRNQEPAKQPEGQSQVGKSGSWKKASLDIDLEKTKTPRNLGRVKSRNKLKWNLKDVSLSVNKFDITKRSSIIHDIDRYWGIRQPCRRKPNYMIKLLPSKEEMSATPASATRPRKQFARKSTSNQHIHKNNSRNIGESSAKRLCLGKYEEPKKPPDKSNADINEVKVKIESNSTNSLPTIDLKEVKQGDTVGASISEVAVTPKTAKLHENSSVTSTPGKNHQMSSEDHAATPKTTDSNSVSLSIPDKSENHRKGSDGKKTFMDTFKESIKKKPLQTEDKVNSVSSVEITTQNDDDILEVTDINKITPNKSDELCQATSNKTANNNIGNIRKKLKSIVNKAMNNVSITTHQKSTLKEEKIIHEAKSESTAIKQVLTSIEKQTPVMKQQYSDQGIIEDNNLSRIHTNGQAKESGTSREITNKISPNVADNQSEISNKLERPCNKDKTPVCTDRDDDVQIISLTCKKCKKQRNLSGGNKHCKDSKSEDSVAMSTDFQVKKEDAKDSNENKSVENDLDVSIIEQDDNNSSLESVGSINDPSEKINNPSEKTSKSNASVIKVSSTLFKKKIVSNIAFTTEGPTKSAVNVSASAKVNKFIESTKSSENVPPTATEELHNSCFDSVSTDNIDSDHIPTSSCKITEGHKSEENSVHPKKQTDKSAVTSQSISHSGTQATSMVPDVSNNISTSSDEHPTLQKHIVEENPERLEKNLPKCKKEREQLLNTVREKPCSLSNILDIIDEIKSKNPSLNPNEDDQPERRAHNEDVLPNISNPSEQSDSILSSKLETTKQSLDVENHNDKQFSICSTSPPVEIEKHISEVDSDLSDTACGIVISQIESHGMSDSITNSSDAVECTKNPDDIGKEVTFNKDSNSVIDVIPKDYSGKIGSKEKGKEVNSDKGKEVMSKEGKEVKSKEGEEVMSKEGEVMSKEGEIMSKEGEVMSKEGEVMSKEPDSTISGSSTKLFIPTIESVFTTTTMPEGTGSSSVLPEEKMDFESFAENVSTDVKCDSSENENKHICEGTPNNESPSTGDDSGETKICVPNDIVSDATLNCNNEYKSNYNGTLDNNPNNGTDVFKRPISPSNVVDLPTKKIKLGCIDKGVTKQQIACPASITDELDAIKKQLPEGYLIIKKEELHSVFQKKAIILLEPKIRQLENLSKALQDYHSKCEDTNKINHEEIAKLQKQLKNPTTKSVECQHEKDFFIRAIKEKSYRVFSSSKGARLKRMADALHRESGSVNAARQRFTNSLNPMPPPPAPPQTTTPSKPPVAQAKSLQCSYRPSQSSSSPPSKLESNPKSPMASVTNTVKSPISNLETMLSTSSPTFTSQCSYLQKSATTKPPQISVSPTRTSTSPCKPAKKSTAPMTVIDLTDDADDAKPSNTTTPPTLNKSPGPPPRLIRKNVSPQLSISTTNQSFPPSVNPALRNQLQAPIKAQSSVRMALSSPSAIQSPPAGPSRMTIHFSNNTTRFSHPQQITSTAHHNQVEHRNVHGSMMASKAALVQTTPATGQRPHPSSAVRAIAPSSLPQQNHNPLLNINHTRPTAPATQSFSQPPPVRGFTSQYRQPTRYPNVQPTATRPLAPPNVTAPLVQQPPLQRVLQPQSRAAYAPPSYTTAIAARPQLPTLLSAPQMQARTVAPVMIPASGNPVILQRHPAMQAQPAPNNASQYPVVVRMPPPSQPPVSKVPISSNLTANSQHHAANLHSTLVRLKQTTDTLQNKQTEIYVKLQSKDLSIARREDLIKTLHEVQEKLHNASQKQNQCQTELTNFHGQSFRNASHQPVQQDVPTVPPQTAASQLLALSQQQKQQQQIQQQQLQIQQQQQIQQRLLLHQHPAPLPPQPVPAEVPIEASIQQLPGRPMLTITRVANGIVLSWTMNPVPGSAEIGFYHLFAYQEHDGPPSSSNWKKIGEVKALPLPMACTLTQFQHGSIYHFSVCAVDVFGRSGEFSKNSSINLTN